MRIDKRMLADIPAWLGKQNDIPSGWLYIGDTEERYLLGEPGGANVLILGVNPSTASPGESNLDPTIKRVRKIVSANGFDGWIMANLYPLRATDPDKLPLQADKKLLERNLKVLGALQSSYYIQRVWAAWGDVIDTRDYLGAALIDIEATLEDVGWYRIGKTTRKGNPRHPLYQKESEKFEPFPIFDYMCSFQEISFVLK